MTYYNLNIARFKLEVHLQSDINTEFENKNILSNKLNNEILLSKFNISEDKKAIYFHKKSNDNNYFILIKSPPIQLEADQEMVAKIKNEDAKQYYQKVIVEKGMEKILGNETNKEYQKNENEPYYYPEIKTKETDFIINIINKRSEVLVYNCRLIDNEV